MRMARERECWDRLAYQLTNQAAIAGAKNVKFEQFHKFYQVERGLTVKKLKAMKGMFNSET